MELELLPQIITFVAENDLDFLTVLVIGAVFFYKQVMPLLRQYLETQKEQFERMIELVNVIKEHTITVESKVDMLLERHRYDRKSNE